MPDNSPWWKGTRGEWYVDIKSRREEKALSAKFSAYAAYQQRVRKLLSYLYWKGPKKKHKLVSLSSISLCQDDACYLGPHWTATRRMRYEQHDI